LFVLRAGSCTTCNRQREAVERLLDALDLRFTQGKMLSLIPSCRYLMFAVFILSNAIICSVSVWNFFIAQAINQYLHIDAFLIFVGALSIAFIFFMIFTEMLLRKSFTCRVWFECIWVGVFFTLEFVGAVGLSVTAPSLMCDPSYDLPPYSCSSTQVLLAFTWICSIILLGYFLLLLISAIVYAKRNPRIWHQPVRHFELPESTNSVESAPTSTSGLTNRKSFMSIKAPRPRRVVPPALFAHRQATSSEFKIEPFHIRPLSTHIIRSPPVAAFPQQMVQNTRPVAAGYQASSFYPAHMQTTLASLPIGSLPTARIRDLPPSPPPLGSWPRLNAVSKPLHEKRQQAPLASLQVRTVTQDVSSGAMSPPAARTRPSGPRSRSRSQTGDWTRPPPLDLSKLSSFGERSRK